MINTLVTIVIPSKNSLEGLKSTLNSILFQTKIKGTRVIVLDYGSTDGSAQYVAHVSSEFFKMLKIECLDFSKESKKIEVDTPYVFFASPGSTFKHSDLIINGVNLNSLTSKNSAYIIDNTKNIFKRFFHYYFPKKDAKGIIGVLCKSTEIDQIKNIKSGDFFNFSIEGDLTRNKYLISSAEIEKSAVILS